MRGSFCFTGAEILKDEEFKRTPFCFENGVITPNGKINVDLSDFWILPGIIDLHGDGFEHHLNPRPSAPFDMQLGLQSAERELSVNGITTAYFAQAYSWEGGYKSPSYATRLLKSLYEHRQNFLTDIRVQIRYEILMSEHIDEIINLVKACNVSYLVYNNHIPVAQQLWKDFPERIENWAIKSSRTGSELIAVVDELSEGTPGIKKKLNGLYQQLKKFDITIGSHDDSTRGERSYFHSIGATICEFPTSIETAKHARSLGNSIIMGAPNVVRGGSQSGSIPATDLIKLGLCDALVSDYYYPALVNAVWTLRDSGLVKFEKAWALISSGPAKALNLKNKGKLDFGYCADFVILNPRRRLIEATFCKGLPSYMSGTFAATVLEKMQ